MKDWDRYGLKAGLDTAKRRLHHNVLAIALANRLTAIVWAVLNKERAFECARTSAASSQPI
jgi:transposase